MIVLTFEFVLIMLTRFFLVIFQSVRHVLFVTVWRSVYTVQPVMFLFIQQTPSSISGTCTSLFTISINCLSRGGWEGGVAC